MPDPRSTINTRAEQLGEEARHEAKAAVVELRQSSRTVRKAKHTPETTLKLVKYGRREVVLPS